VASVNIGQVFAESQRQKDLSAEMKGYEDRTQLELTTRRGKLDEMQAMLDAMDRNDPTFPEKYRNFVRLQIEFKNWFEMTQAEMGREAALWTTRIYDEINGAIAEMAKSQGYDVVLFHDEFNPRSNDPDGIREAINSRRVLYVSQAADLTAAAIEAMNTRYRSQPRQPMLSLPGAAPAAP
jgi:Skp family chaperone for outer membrane proteins